MLWLLAMAGGMGVVLGLWLRVPSVIAASGALVLLCGVVMPLGDWPLLTAIAVSFALVGALQCGYLIGLMLSCVWARATSSPRAAGLAPR